MGGVVITQETTLKIESTTNAEIPTEKTNLKIVQGEEGYAHYEVPRAVSPRPVPDGAELNHPSLYFNRELGWVDFNWRVLHLALDERTPLLERVRFVAITASNLDEFVQKRIGGLKRQRAANVTKLSPDGRTPTEQLNLLNETITVIYETMLNVWENTLKPLLREQANIVICDYNDLESEQREALHRYFAQIYPVLTPLTVDPGHPFPFISNLSLSLAIILRHPEHNTTHFGRVKVPPNQRRFVQIEGDSDQVLRFLPLEQLIAHHIDELFPGLEIVSVHPFRVTRNADLNRDEEEATDLLSMISEELRERRFAEVVRLEVEKGMPAEQQQLLKQELRLREPDVVDVDGLLDLTSCFQIANLNFPQLQFKPWEPIIPGRFKSGRKAKKDIFSIIRQGDLLVHHPYESFAATVQRLVEEAANDDHVLAIKLTLYRTSDESPIVNALIHAAEQGKQVAVLVEVKARFDEASNIGWARRLEDAGVHVAYGLVGLKTHTKATLIVRLEEEEIVTYCHIGTGNYHPKTARLYTDLGLMTCDKAIGNDIVNLFHYLTGFTLKRTYKKIMIAPHNMRSTFNGLIEREIVHQRQSGNGKIIVKMNALDDTKMIRKLYQASQEGVRIDLIIRGHSRLRPGLKGYSENIRVISILGRFLEHDRIFYFHNNDEPQIYIGSADWRGRNLNERVELIAPIENPELKTQLIQILDDCLHDNRLAWDLDADGYYTLRYPQDSEPERNFHKRLMKQAKKRAKKTKKKKRLFGKFRETY
jgi:polyphosphate kinase